MTSNSLDKSNIYDNNMNTSINKNPQKGSFSEQFIFFKEDMLKDIKQLESRISLKYDMQHNINTNKINKIESIIEQLNQKIEFFSTSISSDNTLKDRIDKLSSWNSKLDESLVLQDVRIKSLFTKLSESIDKYDDILSESVIYPGIIGPKAKYKTFHDLIDFILLNINTILGFKDKINLDLKEYKYKTDSTLSSFQIKLEYLTKNANAFTTSSVRTSERKMEEFFNNQLEAFKNQLNDFKNEFNSFTNIQEENILKIIENSPKFENLDKISENSKKIENLEKIIEDMKENQKNEKNEKNEEEKKEITSIKEIIDETNLNNNISSNINNNENMEQIINVKPNKEEINQNDFNVKNATSIVKEYISGKITENDIYKKRKSINCPIPIVLQSIKENENIKYKRDTNSKKNIINKDINKIVNKKNNSYNNVINYINKINNKEKFRKINNEQKESLDKDDGSSSEVEEGEEEEEIDEEEEKENENDTSTLEKNDNKNNDNKNNEKNIKYQKYISGVNKNQNNVFKKEKKININLAKKINTNFDNTSLNYIPISPQVNKNRKNIINRYTNSELEIHQKIMSQDFPIINNDNNTFYLANKNFNSLDYNNKNKIVNKYNDLNKVKDHSINFNLDKTKKYDNIDDIKTIITIIKKESKESLIPVRKNKSPNDKANKEAKNINNKNSIDNSKILINVNNIKNINNLSLNAKKNNLEIINDNNTNIKNFSKTKYDFSKLKLQNTPRIVASPKNEINNNNNLKIPYNEIKKLNKATSVGNFNLKNKLNTKKIEINFNPFPETTKEKDEQKMKKIFSQMKDFLPSDEKVLLKDRFIKYGYDKEKIFINEQNKKSSRVEEDSINNNIVNKNNNILPKAINEKTKK